MLGYKVLRLVRTEIGPFRGIQPPDFSDFSADSGSVSMSRSGTEKKRSASGGPDSYSDSYEEAEDSLEGRGGGSSRGQFVTLREPSGSGELGEVLLPGECALIPLEAANRCVCVCVCVCVCACVFFFL